MKLIKSASGKTQLKITKSEWQKIGQEHYWTEGKDAIPVVPPSDYFPEPDSPPFSSQLREIAVNLNRMADDLDALRGKVGLKD